MIAERVSKKPMEQHFIIQTVNLFCSNILISSQKQWISLWGGEETFSDLLHFAVHNCTAVSGLAALLFDFLLLLFDLSHIG